MTEPTQKIEAEPIPECDSFRTLEAVFTADPRSRSWSVMDPKDGLRAMTVEDRWNNVTDVRLHDGVPTTVCIHFDTARNLMLYSWFVYRFQPVAEMHAYSSLELALKIRAGVPVKNRKKRPLTLGPLLARALSEGWIRDEGFRHYRRAAHRRAELEREGAIQAGREPAPSLDTATQRYVRIVCKALPSLRNNLAHGSPSLAPSGLSTLGLCCDLINQLFPAA